MNEKKVTGDQTVKSGASVVFQIVIIAILVFCCLAAVLPFILLISSSLSDDMALSSKGYGFIPKDFSLYAYQWLFVTNRTTILRSYGLTILVTFAGTLLSLFLTPLYAYPCSRSDYPRAKLFTFICFFTMLFSGGVVGSYIIYAKVFQVRNTFWGLVLPGGLMMNAFNVLLFKNSFTNNIHPSLLEAAKVDGADEAYIYARIVLPLSKPILATVGLMTGIGYWNNWTNGMYYITESRLYTLQILLQRMLQNIQQLTQSGIMGSVYNVENIPSTTIRMAIAVIGTLPVLVLYPFFTKTFVAGISLGGIKE